MRKVLLYLLHSQKILLESLNLEGRPMNGKNKKMDDLTVINGIKSARQDWLRNKLGVQTYQDLASLSTENILIQLKRDNMIVSHNDVILWISKAKELAEAKKTNRQGDWEPFASFVVEFQARRVENGATEQCTSVQHMEADQDMMWPGIETESLCRWMLDRIESEEIGMKEQPQPIKQSPPKPHMMPQAILKNQLQVFQPPNSETPCITCLAGQPGQGYVKSEQPFELRDLFSISWLEKAASEAGQVTCYAQFYARQLPAGVLIHLGDTEAEILGENQASCTVRLTGAVLPAGLYSLKVLTRIATTPPILDHLEIPMIQVL